MLTRRQFVQLGASACGLLLLPQGSFGVSSRREDPHFFLHLFIFGGADFSYLWDARPLAMTAAGKIQNYLGEEPRLETGSNGGTCYMTSLCDPFLSYRDRFSIVNGVHMLTSFDGHPQNVDFWFTGNAFGGESFLPHLNEAREGLPPTSLDVIENGPSIATISNGGGMVSLSPSSVGPVNEKFGQLRDPHQDAELATHLSQRFATNGQGRGRFAASARAMGDGFNLISGLRERFLRMPSADPNTSEEQQFATLLSGAFRNSMARSAEWVIFQAGGSGFDTHDPGSARRQPDIYRDLGEKIGRIFAALSTTPFDRSRSLLDVTTLILTTEFGRTMRIEGNPIDATGTNHNPYTNSMLIGGKGIRGGMVVGASDFSTAGEVLSPAHLHLDPLGEKVMGRPFDALAMRQRADLPSVFAAGDYLNCASVVNTIYDLFKVDVKRHRLVDRNGPPAPVLRGLLS